jgi:ATP-dependent Clp protease ATP-binding subunit ClpA
MGKRKKPLASFLFLGPTGVGKTETAKTVAQVFFGSDKSLLRFDMSAFQSQNDMSQLIGSSETGNPGLLTKSIREQPYGVLLLDELEKANKDLLNIFLTVLDEGYFTDGMGEKVDCKNLIIVATSNAGADVLYKQTDMESLQQTLMNILIERHIFSPEFINRFDGVVAFNPLQSDDVTIIANTMLQNIVKQIAVLYKVNISVSPQTLKTIVEENYNPSFGARDIERVLRKEIEDKIAKLILSNQAKEGDTIQL